MMRIYHFSCRIVHPPVADNQYDMNICILQMYFDRVERMVFL